MVCLSIPSCISDNLRCNKIASWLDSFLFTINMIFFHRRKRYDRYGFSVYSDDNTESALLATASQLEKHASDILQSLSNFNDSVAIKWQNYFILSK